MTLTEDVEYDADAEATARLARRQEAPTDPDAEEFRKRYGYPIDAKRLSAGRYRLTGTDGWNQTDPTSPDGLRVRYRGEMLTLTEHEASRLLFLGAIDDPDQPPRAVAQSEAVSTEATRKMRTLLDHMNEQIIQARTRQFDSVPQLERRRDRLQEEIDVLAEQLAKLDTEIGLARKAQKLSDDEIAESFGRVFVETRQRLRDSVGAGDAQ